MLPLTSFQKFHKRAKSVKKTINFLIWGMKVEVLGSILGRQDALHIQFIQYMLGNVKKNTNYLLEVLQTTQAWLGDYKMFRFQINSVI